MGTSNPSFQTSQMRKVEDTLHEQGVTPEILQRNLLEGGYLSDIAEAAAFGVLPSRKELRNLYGLNAKTNPHHSIVINYGTKKNPRTLGEMISSIEELLCDRDSSGSTKTFREQGRVEYFTLVANFPNKLPDPKALHRFLSAEPGGKLWMYGGIEHLVHIDWSQTSILGPKAQLYAPGGAIHFGRNDEDVLVPYLTINQHGKKWLRWELNPFRNGVVELKILLVRKVSN
ncbi:MAG: hypothetical protein U0522_02810 [Candidatus Paceibacterota bacterium]